MELGKGVSKLFISYAVLAQEVGQTQDAKADLTVSLRRKVFPSVTHTSLGMELHQGSHSIHKCIRKFLRFTCTNVNMLKQTSATTTEINLQAYITVDTITEGIMSNFIKPDVTFLNAFDSSFN
jgi:hypothetical protein